MSRGELGSPLRMLRGTVDLWISPYPVMDKLLKSRSFSTAYPPPEEQGLLHKPTVPTISGQVPCPPGEFAPCWRPEHLSGFTFKI